MAKRGATPALKEPDNNDKFRIPVADLVYEYVMENYLVKWYKAGTFSSHNYMKALQELDKLKSKSKKKKNQDEEVKEVRQLPNPPVNNKPRPQTAQPNQRQPGHSQQHEHQKLILQLTDTNEELENRICELDILLREKSREVDRLTDDLDNARDEVKALTMRVSKLAGDRLRDNNPNITDLSDQNRPTELGKRYSEIYDNHWSDAFEHIPGKSEDQKVKILYAVMEGAFEFCQKMTKSQVTDVRDVLLSKSTLADASSRSSSPTSCPSSVAVNRTSRSDNLYNLLKDTRRQFAPITATNLALNYSANELSNLLQGFDLKKKKGEVLIPYAKECVEVCWYMTVCDPPMAISQGDVMKPFDANIYKPYTRSTKDMNNPVVESNIWPALYLNFNGPLVAKGVAQPKDSKTKK